MSLLGIVSKVQSTGLQLSLPFALSAKCSLAEAIDTERYDFQSGKLPFQEGDIVPCSVISLERSADRNVIWVSLRPKVVNAGLSSEQLNEGELVYGWVASAEDHGFTIETGIERTRAFLPHLENDGSNGQGSPLSVGAPIWSAVKELDLETSGTNALLKLECYSHDFEGSIEKDKLSKKQSDTVNTKINKFKSKKDDSSRKEDPSKKDEALVAGCVSIGRGYKLSGLKPGFLVKAEISKVVKHGLIVSFLGFYQGFIGIQHLPFPADAMWKDLYSKGQKVYARIVSVDTVEKHIILNAVPHIVRMHKPSFSYGIGDVMENATVLRVDPKVGIMVGIENRKNNETARKFTWDKIAFIHVSRLSDKRIENIDQLYRIGAEVSCRIVGYSWLDGIALASSQKSILNSPIFSFDDLSPGKLVRGMPTNESESGIIFTIGSKIKGFVPNLHLLDNVTDGNSHTMKKYKSKIVDEEQYISARVLSVDKTKRRLILTSKPSLVETTYPIIASYSDAADIVAQAAAKEQEEKENTAIVHGVVDKVTDSGIVVAFYGNVKGFIHKSELVASGIDNFTTDFRRGEVIRTRIVSVDPVRERMKLTTQLSGDVHAERKEGHENDTSDIEEGIQKVEVIGILDDNRRFHVSPTAGNIKKFAKFHESNPLSSEPYFLVFKESRISMLPMRHLSDHEYICRQLFKSYIEQLNGGTKLTVQECMAVEMKKLSNAVYRVHQKYLSREIQIMTAKPSLLWSEVQKEPIVKCPRHYMELTQGDIVIGYVVSVTAFGVFVRSRGGCTGMVPRSSLMQESESTLDYSIGQTVVAIVQSIDEAKGNYVLTLRTGKVYQKIRNLKDKLLQHPQNDEASTYGNVNFPSLFISSAVSGEDDIAPTSTPPTLEEKKDDDESSEDDEQQKSSMSLTHSAFYPGKKVDATVEDIREYGALCSILESGTTVFGFLHKSFCEDESLLKVGASFKANVLDVDVEKGIIDIAPRKKGKSGGKKLIVGDAVECTIELVRRKDQRLRYAVVRITGSKEKFGILCLSDYFVSSDQAERILHTSLEKGTGVKAIVSGVNDEHIQVPLLNPFLHTANESSSTNESLIPVEDLRPGMKAVGVVVSGFSKRSGGLIPMQVKLLGVRGKYKCVIPLCEAVDCNLNKLYEEPQEVDEALLDAALSLGQGTEVTLKITSVIIPTKKVGNKETLVRGTLKQSDLEIEGENLSTCRPSLQPLYEQNKMPTVYEPAPLNAPSRENVLEDEVPSNSGLREGLRLKPGTVCSGMIERVEPESITIGLGGGVRGKCYISELADSAKDVQKRIDTINIGDLMSVVVLNPNTHTQFIEVSYRALPLVMRKAKHFMKNRLNSTPGKRQKKSSTKASEAEANTISISNFASELRESVREFISMYPGKKVVCRVERLHSAVESLKESVEKLHGQQEEHSYLNQDTRLRVTFGPTLEKFGYINAVHSSDLDAWKSFPFADLEDDEIVDAVILNCPKESNDAKDATIPMLRNRFELSFRDSCVEKSNALQSLKEPLNGRAKQFVEWLTQQENDLFERMRSQSKARGYILNTSKKGCFVQLTLFHVARILMSDLSNSYVTNVAQEFPPAKLVTGKITSYDRVKQRIDMSLKDVTKQENSLSSLEWLREGAILDGVVDSVTEFGAFVRLIHPKTKTVSDTKGLCHVSQLADQAIERSRLSIMEQVKPGNTVCVYVLKVDTEKGKVGLSMKPSVVQKGIHTSATNGKLSTETSRTSSMGKLNSLNELQDDSDVEMEDNGVGRSDSRLWSAPEWSDDKKSKTNLSDIQTKLSFTGKEDVRVEEKRRASGEQNPTTISDYEKLIASNPHSSHEWIRYMAFLVSTTEIEKAREMAEKALLALRFDEKSSRDIWIAYLNFEQRYGDDERVKNVYNRAVQSNSPSLIRRAMANILQECGDIDGAESVWKKLIATEKVDRDTWAEYFQFLISNGKAEEIHENLPTAISHVPPSDHTWLLQKVGILEFKHGNPEKGRTIMENIISSYPHRSDLWNVYIDQEVSSGNYDHARNLFERATSNKWNPKKMKPMFKKWIAFENKAGSSETHNHVKSRAEAYVQSL